MPILQDILLQNQLRVRESPGDGHCLFHSFASSWSNQFAPEPNVSLNLLLAGVRLRCLKTLKAFWPLLCMAVKCINIHFVPTCKTVVKYCKLEVLAIDTRIHRTIERCHRLLWYLISAVLLLHWDNRCKDWTVIVQVKIINSTRFYGHLGQ